jgi:DNA-binding NarL/FixJ family response regulator
MDQVHVAVASEAPLVLLGLATILRQDQQLTVVAEVRDALTATAAAGRFPCDVLLVDTATPALTASRVLPHLVEHSPATKLLIVTENAGRDQLLAALRGGVLGYAVQGDLAPEELCHGVVTLARHGVWTCPTATRMLLIGALLDDAAAAAPARLSPTGRPRRSQLSARELAVLRMAAAGKREGQIASDLNVSPNTVKTYLRRICEKLRAPSRADAIQQGITLGLVTDGFSADAGASPRRASGAAFAPGPAR